LVSTLLRLTRYSVLGLWLAWAFFALVSENRGAMSAWNRRQENALPNRWEFGGAPVNRLQRCLAGVEGLLPRDSVVLFDSPDGPLAARFFRWRWAAYFLPDLNVAPPQDDRGASTASYAIGYHLEPTPPPGSHLDFSRQLDGCRLYRIVRP
jgi:hypothetical protein